MTVLRTMPHKCENGFQSTFKLGGSFNHALNITDTTGSLKIRPLSIILDTPVTSNNHVIDVPHLPIKYINDDKIVNEIKDPNCGIEKKIAVVLIIIRRKKMKKHKLRKLRKKMKFVWAKIRQRREMRKEKAFQAELIGQIKEAEKFNPANYALEKINLANEVLMPTRWKGKQLPEFVIKEQLAKHEKKKMEELDTIKRRKKIHSEFNNYFEKV